MRILWFNHRDIEHPAAGGAERTVFEVSRRLSAAGDEVHLVSAGWIGSKSRTVIDGVQLSRFPSYGGPHLAQPFLLRSRSRPDVVIDDLAHVIPWGSPWLSSIPGTVFFRHLHARTLSGQVGPTTARFLEKVERSYRLVYRDWPFVTETLASVRDLSRLGIPETRCRVIRPGVDTRLFKPGTKATTPLIVYFGGMRRYKRPEHALRAFASLRAAGSNFDLAVVGSGPELPGLRVLAERLKLGSSVSFLGRVDRQHLSRVLSRAWVNLHCSTAEGWGYSLLEAAASGVPTVAYRVPGLTESVAEGVSGLLVNENEPEALARGVTEILSKIREWAETSRDYSLRFDWNATASAWQTHLRGLVE